MCSPRASPCPQQESLEGLLPVDPFALEQSIVTEEVLLIWTIDRLIWAIDILRAAGDEGGRGGAGAGAQEEACTRR